MSIFYVFNTDLVQKNQSTTEKLKQIINRNSLACLHSPFKGSNPEIISLTKNEQLNMNGQNNSTLAGLSYATLGHVKSRGKPLCMHNLHNELNFYLNLNKNKSKNKHFLTPPCCRKLNFACITSNDYTTLTSTNQICCTPNNLTINKNEFLKKNLYNDNSTIKSGAGEVNIVSDSCLNNKDPQILTKNDDNYLNTCTECRLTNQICNLPCCLNQYLTSNAKNNINNPNIPVNCYLNANEILNTPN